MQKHVRLMKKFTVEGPQPIDGKLQVLLRIEATDGTAFEAIAPIEFIGSFISGLVAVAAKAAADAPVQTTAPQRVRKPAIPARAVARTKQAPGPGLQGLMVDLGVMQLLFSLPEDSTTSPQ